MNIKKLKLLIENLPDEDPVLMVAGNNHECYDVSGEYTTVLKQGSTWNEDFGELDTPEAVFGKRRNALIIRT